MGNIGGHERVLGLYVIRRSWSTLLKTYPFSQPRLAINRLMNSCEALERNDRTKTVSPTMFLHSFENELQIEVPREIRIVRHKDHRPGFVF